MAEENAYILGTDSEELFRLGVQHQVWASEAQRGWGIAGFTAGQTLLDLGCGPGFCTKEMALITGKSGRVIGIDKSVAYINFLNDIKDTYGLNIDGHAVDFNQMQLEDNSLDGAYCRWAMAWISNPEEIIQKVYKALKPGGRFVFHEYFHWMTHLTVPSYENLSACIKGCFDSFEDFDGSINIGRNLPEICVNSGFTLFHTRPMAKTARVNDLAWQWPITFYKTYFNKLIDMKYVTQEQVSLAFEELEDLSSRPDGLICCPLMIEIIVEK